MRQAEDFYDLKLPEKQRGFLRIFLDNLSMVSNVDRVILFGSCARGTLREGSDVDLFVVTREKATADEEIYIMAECPPDYESEYYLQSDIIIKPQDQYEKYKSETGMVQKYVELEGVELTGLLQKRPSEAFKRPSFRA